MNELININYLRFKEILLKHLEDPQPINVEAFSREVSEEFGLTYMHGSALSIALSNDTAFRNFANKDLEVLCDAWHDILTSIGVTYSKISVEIGQAEIQTISYENIVRMIGASHILVESNDKDDSQIDVKNFRAVEDFVSQYELVIFKSGNKQMLYDFLNKEYIVTKLGFGALPRNSPYAQVAIKMYNDLPD